MIFCFPLFFVTTSTEEQRKRERASKEGFHAVGFTYTDDTAPQKNAPASPPASLTGSDQIWRVSLLNIFLICLQNLLKILLCLRLLCFQGCFWCVNCFALTATGLSCKPPYSHPLRSITLSSITRQSLCKSKASRYALSS